MFVTGPECFAFPFGVVAYNGPGCLEDVLAGTVILLQLDDLGARKVFFELKNVLTLSLK